MRNQKFAIYESNRDKKKKKNRFLFEDKKAVYATHRLTVSPINTIDTDSCCQEIDKTYAYSNRRQLALLEVSRSTFLVKNLFENFSSITKRFVVIENYKEWTYVFYLFANIIFLSSLFDVE